MYTASGRSPAWGHGQRGGGASLTINSASLGDDDDVCVRVCVCACVCVAGHTASVPTLFKNARLPHHPTHEESSSQMDPRAPPTQGHRACWSAKQAMVVTSTFPVLPPDPTLLTPSLEKSHRGHRAAVLSVGISPSLGQVSWERGVRAANRFVLTRSDPIRS